MSKPATILEWATDANFPAGADPWSAQPNKVEPAAAKVDVGRQPTELPPAEETNWWRSMVSRFVAHLVSMRLLNWCADYVYTAVSATGAPGSGCFDQSVPAFYVGTSNGEIITSLSGVVWDDDGGGAAAGPWVGATAVSDIDSDDSGRRVAVAVAGADFVEYSTTPGTWAPCTITTGPGLNWRTVESDSNASGGGAVWLLGAAASAVVYRSTDGVTFNAVTVTGFTGTYPLIIASKDPNNDTWIILDGTNAARSSDQGATWTTTPHGLLLTGPNATYRRRICAYDKATSRFVVIGLPTTGDVHYTEDNGITWVTVAGALPVQASPSDAVIISSRDGELLAHIGDQGFWGSFNGGETWRKVELPDAPTGGVGVGAGNPVFGAGRFLMAGGTATAPPDINLSLRAEG